MHRMRPITPPAPRLTAGTSDMPVEPEARSRGEAAEAGLCFGETTWAQCVDATGSIGVSRAGIEALPSAPAATGA